MTLVLKESVILSKTWLVTGTSSFFFDAVDLLRYASLFILDRTFPDRLNCSEISGECACDSTRFFYLNVSYVFLRSGNVTGGLSFTVYPFGTVIVRHTLSKETYKGSVPLLLIG